jgi:hypothetical protein
LLTTAGPVLLMVLAVADHAVQPGAGNVSHHAPRPHAHAPVVELVVVVVHRGRGVRVQGRVQVRRLLVRRVDRHSVVVVVGRVVRGRGVRVEGPVELLHGVQVVASGSVRRGRRSSRQS